MRYGGGVNAGRRSRIATLLVASLLGGLVLVSEAFEHPAATGFGDYGVFHLMWEAARTTVLVHGELPLWNPYICGGMPEWGYGNSQVFHPLFLVALAFGSTLGLKLFLWIHAAAGLAGAYLLARREIRLRVGPSAFTASLFGGTSFFAWHCGLGHANFIPFYLLPWLVLAWRRAAEDHRHAVGVAVVLALAVLGGGDYPFVFFVIVLGFEACASAATPRRASLVPAVCAAGGLTLLLGGVRLLPVLTNVTRFPKLVRSVDSMTPIDVVHAWTDRATRWAQLPWRGHTWNVVEYGCYLGWAVLALSVVGGLVAFRHGQRRLLVGALLFLILALGAFAPWAPWALLHRLPVLESLQVPSRWLLIGSFYLILLAGLGMQWLLDRAMERGPAFGIGAGLVAVVLVADVWAIQRAVVDGQWSRAPVDVGPREPRFFLWFVPAKPVDRRAPRQPARPQIVGWNVGTGSCYTGMGYLPALGLWSGDSPQVRAVPADGAEIEEVARSSLRWKIRARVERPTRVVFNSTWEQDWVAPPYRVIEDLGRLAVDLPPGDHEVTLRYEPRSLPWALGAFALGALLALALARRRRPALAVATAVLGLGALAIYVWLARERVAPSSPSLELVRADGVRPQALIDRQPETTWLLERVPGAIDVRFAPRPLSWVALLNGRDFARHDIGAADVLVTAYDGDTPVAVRAARFPDPIEEPQRQALRLEAARADRLEIRVLTKHGRAGALSQLDFATTAAVGEPMP